MIFYFYFFFLSFEFVHFQRRYRDIRHTNELTINHWVKRDGICCPCTFLLARCKGDADFWDCLAHTALLPLFAVFLLSPIRRFSPVTPDPLPAIFVEGDSKYGKSQASGPWELYFRISCHSKLFCIKRKKEVSWGCRDEQLEKWINSSRRASWECACGCTKLLVIGIDLLTFSSYWMKYLGSSLLFWASA